MSAHEVFALLVGEIGYNRHEFLRELKLWEIRAIVRGYRRRAALTWEPARFQTYAWLSARGAKNIRRPQDVVTFPWEKKAEPISDEDAEDIRGWLRAAKEAKGSD
jgi:hypothetical protein